MADNIIVTRDALTAWLDQGKQLDHALAGLRLLSAAITEATERGDTRAIRGLSDLRAEMSVEVDRLLAIADEAVER